MNSRESAELHQRHYAGSGRHTRFWSRMRGDRRARRRAADQLNSWRRRESVQARGEAPLTSRPAFAGANIGATRPFRPSAVVLRRPYRLSRRCRAGPRLLRRLSDAYTHAVDANSEEISQMMMGGPRRPPPIVNSNLGTTRRHRYPSIPTTPAPPAPEGAVDARCRRSFNAPMTPGDNRLEPPSSAL